MAWNSGRSRSGTGSSSPTSVTSYTALASAAFVPKPFCTVSDDTPAAFATCAIVVVAYPWVSRSSRATSMIRRRVARACSARLLLS